MRSFCNPPSRQKRICPRTYPLESVSGHRSPKQPLYMDSIYSDVHCILYCQSLPVVMCSESKQYLNRERSAAPAHAPSLALCVLFLTDSSIDTQACDPKSLYESNHLLSSILGYDLTQARPTANIF